MINKLSEIYGHTLVRTRQNIQKVFDAVIGSVHVVEAHVFGSINTVLLDTPSSTKVFMSA